MTSHNLISRLHAAGTKTRRRVLGAILAVAMVGTGCVAGSAYAAGRDASGRSVNGTVVDTAHVTNGSSVTIVADGEQPFDADDEPGDDSGNANGIVRSFDFVTYDMNVHMDAPQGVESNKATFGFEITLPYGPNQVRWDTSSSFFHDVSLQTTDSSTVITGYADVTKGDRVLPGVAQVPITLQVLGMLNGSTVQPEFKFWMNGGTDDPNRSDHTLDPTEVSASAVTVSAKLQLNVQLTALNADRSKSATGTYDFDSGNDDAINKGQGQRHGDLYGYGVGLQLKNLDTNKGLKGIEVPAGDIKVKVDFSTQLSQNGGKYADADAEFQPLIYSVEGNTFNGNKPNADGRSLTSAEGTAPSTNYITNLPGNTGGKTSTNTPLDECENGGTWSAEGSGSSAVLTISGAEITNWLFPAAALRMKRYQFYDEGTSVEKLAKAYFSAGEVWVVQPLKSKDGTVSINPQDSVTNGKLTAQESLISAYTASDPDTAITQQTLDTDDLLTGTFTIENYTGGLMDPSINYAGGLGYHSDSNNKHTHEDNNGDYAIRGQELAIRAGYNYNAHNQTDYISAGSNILVKFDGDALEVVKKSTYNDQIGKVYSVEKQSGNNNAGKWKVYWGYLADGNGEARNWNDDQEMRDANELSLQWDSERQEGKKYVAALFEERGGIARKSANAQANGYSAYIEVKVRDGAAVEQVYPTMVLTRVWSYKDQDTLTAKGKSIPSVGTEGWEDDWADATTGDDLTLTPKGSPIPNSYVKPTYDENLQISDAGYHNRHMGDSMLVLPYRSHVTVKHAQTTGETDSHGNPVEKSDYAITNGERTADYVIQPSLVQKTDAQGDQGTTTVTITATLPAGMTYVEGSSYYGGTYEQQEPGERGKVKNGEMLDPQITVDANGRTVLTWTLTDVPIKDGDLDQIHYSVKLGNEGHPSQDLQNKAALTTDVVIKTTEDRRTPDTKDADVANESRVTTTVSRNSNTSFYKYAVKELNELNEDPTWRVGVYNPNTTARQVYLLDIMPRQGVGKTHFENHKDGEQDYNVSVWIANSDKIENLDGNNYAKDNNAAKTYQYLYYTTNEKYGNVTTDKNASNYLAPENITANASDDTSAVSDWYRLPIYEDGHVEFPTNVQPVAWAVIGMQQPKEQVDIKVSVHQSKDKANNLDVFDNHAYWEDFSQSGKAYRVARHISGRAWIDENHDGLQDKSGQPDNPSFIIKEGRANNTEEKMPNVKVHLECKGTIDEASGKGVCSADGSGDWIQAYDVFGDRIEDVETSEQTSTDKNYLDGGYYDFDKLAQGTYRVTFLPSKGDDFGAYRLTTLDTDKKAYDDWINSKASDPDMDHSDADEVNKAVISDVVLPSAGAIYGNDYNMWNTNYLNAGFYLPGRIGTMPHAGWVNKWVLLSIFSILLVGGSLYLTYSDRDGRRSSSRHAAQHARQ